MQVRLVGGGGALVGQLGGGAIQHRVQPAVPRRQLGLAVEQLGDLLFHQLLVEQLAAGDAVDLRPQRRDAVFIGLLDARLARRAGADQIVAQNEIGGGEQIADGDRQQRRAAKCGKPRPDGEMPDIVAMRDDDGVWLFTPAEYR